MNRICVFYSVGSHYLVALKALKQLYPDATLTALVPLGHPGDEALRSAANEILHTELSHYAPTDVAATLRLLRRIRSRYYDAFAVLFDSPQLRLLASLSGAPQLFHCTEDGRVLPLHATPIGVTLDTSSRAVWGRIAYLSLWTIVRLFPVRR